MKEADEMTTPTEEMQTEAKHTPGEVVFVDGMLGAPAGPVICQFWNKREEDFDNAKANGRRVLALWNEAERMGLSTEAIEQGVLSELLAALKRLCARFPEDVSDDGSGRIGFVPELIEAVKEGRSAINKALGKS